MPLALTLLARSAPAPAQLAALRALGEAVEVELILACADRRLPATVATVRPLAPGEESPVALLHAALVAARGEPLVALDADQPLPPPELVRALASHPARCNVLLVAGDPPRALPGRYRRACLGALRRALCAGERDLLAVTRALHATLAEL